MKKAASRAARENSCIYLWGMENAEQKYLEVSKKMSYLFGFLEGLLMSAPLSDSIKAQIEKALELVDIDSI